MSKASQTIQNTYRFFTEKPLVLLALLMIISFVMKLMFLGTESMWLDEASTLRWALMPFAEIFETSLEDPNGPIYQLLLKVWISAFGISEFSTRFLPAIFGTLLMWPVYLIGRNLFDKNVGFLAAILCMLSNNLLFWSHENRGYTLVVLLAIWSFYHFFKILNKGKAANLVWYTLITTLLVFTHLTATMVVVAQFAASLLYLRSEFKRAVMIYVGMFVATALIVFWVLQNSWIGGGETVWSPIPNSKTVVGLFKTYLNGINVLYFVLICLSIFLSRTFLFKVKYNNWRKLSAILLWGLLPVLVTFLVSVYYNPRFLPKYMLYTVPGLYLSISALIMGISKNRWVQLLLAIILVLLMVKTVNLNPVKQEKWRKAVAMHNEYQTPESISVICAYYQAITFSYYYDIEIFKDYKNRDRLLDQEKIFRMCSLETLQAQLNKYRDADRLILILSHDVMFDRDEIMLDYLKDNYYLMKYRKDLLGIRVYVFDLSKTTLERLPEVTMDSISIPAKEFNTMYTERIDEIGGNIDNDGYLNLNLNVSCTINSDKETKGMRLVLTTKGDNSKNFWKGIYLDELIPGTPFVIDKDVTISGEFDPESELTIYVWQPNEQHSFTIKDLDITIY